MSQPVTSCPRCERRTPAARGNCIYCGEPLPLTDISAAPLQRNIETDDLAYNAILEPGARSSPSNDEALQSFAVSMGLELLEAQSLISAAKPVPIARCQTQSEAEMICRLVRLSGLNAVVVPDEDLRLQDELLRARRIDLSDEEINITHSNGTLTLRKSDVKLLVLGELRSRRVDYIEGLRAREGGASGVLDSSEFYSEETVLDVYADTVGRSFRIKSDAFDYSGLVSPMSFRSDLNFKAGIKKLGEELPNATMDNDFSGMGSLLARAWPERTRNETRGFKRTGLGFRSVAKASSMSDNRDQFERYSRLMFREIAPPNRS